MVQRRYQQRRWHSMDPGLFGWIQAEAVKSFDAFLRKKLMDQPSRSGLGVRRWLLRRGSGRIVRLGSRRGKEARKNEEQEGEFQRVIANVSHILKTQKGVFSSRQRWVFFAFCAATTGT
jgi:hypothetical protein